MKHPRSLVLAWSPLVACLLLSLLWSSDPFASALRDRLAEGGSQRQNGTFNSRLTSNDTYLAKCYPKTQCQFRQRLKLASPVKPAPCQCDHQCTVYDDCCADAPKAVKKSERASYGLAQLKNDRDMWRCRLVEGDKEHGSEGIQVRAKCPAKWSTNVPNISKGEAQLIEDKCSMEPSKRFPVRNIDTLKSLLMPVTDLDSNITYANSFCLRCSQAHEWLQHLAKLGAASIGASTSSAPSPKLVYWSPNVECNFGKKRDNQTVLVNRMVEQQGVLQFMPSMNKWIIRVYNDDDGGAGEIRDGEQTCTVSPVMPKQVTPTLRFCRPTMIRSCPQKVDSSLTVEERKQLGASRIECNYGHQLLTYPSKNEAGDVVYYNLGCAFCNGERDTTLACGRLQGLAYENIFDVAFDGLSRLLPWN